MSRKEEGGLGVRRWELGRWGIGIFLCWPNGYGDSLGIISSLGESKSKFWMDGMGTNGLVPYFILLGILVTLSPL